MILLFIREFSIKSLHYLMVVLGSKDLGLNVQSPNLFMLANQEQKYV